MMNPLDFFSVGQCHMCALINSSFSRVLCCRQNRFLYNEKQNASASVRHFVTVIKLALYLMRAHTNIRMHANIGKNTLCKIPENQSFYISH